MKHGIVWFWMAAVSAVAQDMAVSAELMGGRDVSSPEVVRARDVATKIMASAGVRLEWCSTEKECSHWDERLLVTLVTEAPPNVPRGVLADARVFEGRNIRVFMDHLRPDIRGGHRGSVIGHILAHEITHLLQSCKCHARTGLMKPQFGAADYFIMAKRTLPLEEFDIELIRLGWARRRQLATD